MDYLIHHGIKGQKWGVRRFRNKDGSLTQEGKEQYYNMMPESAKRGMLRAYNDSINKKIQYLQDTNNKYKIVSGGKLRGSRPDSSSILGEYREFNSGTSPVSMVARKAVRGWNGEDYEEYDDKYPVFENAAMAAAFAKTLDELPDGSYAKAMFENDPNIKRALYNTAMQDAVLREYAMPTSARKAQKEAQKKEEERKRKEAYEARMKANIPASAWNERMRALKK